jgi:hypothetical protein
MLFVFAFQSILKVLNFGLRQHRRRHMIGFSELAVI